MSAMTMGVHHVGLSVRDLEESKAFYRDVLGLEVVGENPGVSAFLTDHTNMITLWQTADAEASVAAAGLHHLAFRVAKLELLQELEDRLRERGAKVQFEGYGEYGGLVGIFFYDPNGIRLEVTTEHHGAHGGGLPTIGGCGAF